MTKLKLSLENVGGHAHIHIQVLDPERFVGHGSGSFMCDVENEEVEITAAARDALLEGQERDGLQAMEFWEERRLGWASTDHDFLAPVAAINVPAGAKEWIKQLGG